MIHSARPIVTPVATIVLYCFVFLDLKSGDGRTDGRTTCAKTMITTGRDFGLAECINSDLLLFLLFYIDPRGQLTVTAGSDHYFLTCCLSVRTSFPTFQNIITFQAIIVIATGRTVGLASWIIDGIHVL